MIEKIAAAAISIKGHVFTGRTHFQCMASAIKSHIMPADELANAMLEDSVDGFVTNEGRFVTREEAFEIASKEKQLIDSPYAEPEANKEFYNVKTPSLDSGLIKEYAQFTARGLALLG